KGPSPDVRTDHVRSAHRLSGWRRVEERDDEQISSACDTSFRGGPRGPRLSVVEIHHGLRPTPQPLPPDCRSPIGNPILRGSPRRKEPATCRSARALALGLDVTPPGRVRVTSRLSPPLR